MQARLIITIFLFACVSCSHGTKFTSLESEFREMVSSLYLETSNTPYEGLEVKITALGKAIFGNHPTVLREEVIRRFDALPVFSAAQLGDYNEIASVDDFLPSERKYVGFWLTIGWNPENIAGFAKESILTRQLGVDLYARRSLLSVYAPDKFFRLVSAHFSGLVVESLGDIFVIKIEMTDEGVFKPVSIRWMEKKKIGAKIQATPLQQ